MLLFHINGEHARRLAGIQDKQQPMGAAEVPHPADVDHVAGQVGGMGADHGLCVGPQQPFKVIIVDLSPPVRRDEIHNRPLLPQAVQGPQDGIVLQVRGDHMVSRSQQSADGDVQGLGGVGRKAHMVRPRAAQEPGHLLPDGEHRPGRGQRLLMGAPAAVAPGHHGRCHRLRHAGRLGPGSGRVIQIDHGLMTFPAPASVSTMVYMLVTDPTASLSVRP